MLLALIAGYKAQQPIVKLKKCINAIEKFHFIFSAVCTSRAFGLEVTYSRLARELRESNSMVVIGLIIGCYKIGINFL